MIVLDTHAWVWWVSQMKGLSEEARAAINHAEAAGAIYVSSISAWEAAMLVAKGRLKLTLEVDDWINRSEALPFLNFVPVDNLIAVRSTRLPEYPHADPADRIIIATAVTLGMAVVTKDRKIRGYPRVKTIW